MKKISLIALSMVILSCAESVKYDLILRNGTIYDGSGNTPVTGDIGVNADTISAIGDLSAERAKAEIDARGLAVAPGFINMLSWANVSLIEDGCSQSDIRQGVTLEVMGEGRSMGPWNNRMKQEARENQGDIKYDIEWTTLGEYLSYLENRGVSTNVTSFVGNGTLRQHVIGYEDRVATDAEIEQMKELLAASMKEGAVGISSSLLYAPSSSASTTELIELAKVASDYDGMYISHIRSEGDELFESIRELITISRKANLPAEIYHLKASGENNWWKMDSVLSMIKNARSEGLSITADMYTYPASSTGLHVQLPAWVREGGVEATIERLANVGLRERILSDIEFQHSPDKILLVGFKNPDLRVHAGKRLSEIAQKLGKSAEETMIDLIVEDDSRIQVVYFSMSDENIAKKIVRPWMSFCSDAGSMTADGIFLKQSTHPRAYGSFVRVLGKYSRDMKLFPLEEGIRRLTSLPAENLKIKKRGRLQTGYFADIVIFDPERVNDVATFEAPHQYAEGVLHVFVNGVQVLKNGQHTNAKPGRFVKGPGFRKAIN
ncbi:D-aminoacylase [Fulvivirga sp. M361]|uniref:N-acyl-D-amino-acid deacylase family protein n=1 Tax=Fulvivirga sp. M361 TaxID=2594266 RepID=UPI001179B0C9|nr:D-aminoacylase [Fulvivirga sp. M361]TRX62654.1 D-aminoacylase [Fulvivirga sp. M361]